jgi:aryl-alcohol dehydrogenase-like predicted oxidoreductase
MNMVTLGRTEMQVSRIAFGAWQFGGDWGAFQEGEAIAAIRHARELGINLFDTAQAYGWGRSESIVGTALRDELDGHRDEIVIATKGGLRLSDDGLVRDSSPEWLRKGVEQSLATLGVDHIDLFQIHWPDPDTPLAESAGALDELVAEGKIRHAGVSNFSAEQMEELAHTRPIETLQPPYNMLRREAEYSELPYARRHDIGVLVYGPLAHGLLTGAFDAGSVFEDGDWRRQSGLFRGDAFRRNLEAVAKLERLAAAAGHTVSRLAIAWVLEHPAVHVAIFGSLNPAHIEDSVAALDVHLSAGDNEEIERILLEADAYAGPTPETVG